MTTTVRLASAPINWGIESPDGVGNPTPDEVLRNSVEAGYTGFELGPLHYLGSDPASIRRRFDQYSLDPVAYWVAVPFAHSFGGSIEAEVREALETLRAIGAPVLLVSDFGDPRRMEIVARVDAMPDAWWSDADWSEARRTFASLADLGKQYGVEIALHPHVGGHIESGREIERALQALDGIDLSVCIDTGHIRLGGSDPIALMRRLGPRVRHIHAKDVDAAVMDRLQHGEIDYRTAVATGLYCDLGAGVVDWEGFASALADIDYSGWIVAEEDQVLVPDREAPFHSNIANRAFLSRLLAD